MNEELETALIEATAALNTWQDERGDMAVKLLRYELEKIGYFDKERKIEQDKEHS